MGGGRGFGGGFWCGGGGVVLVLGWRELFWLLLYYARGEWQSKVLKLR